MVDTHRVWNSWNLRVCSEAPARHQPPCSALKQTDLHKKIVAISHSAEFCQTTGEQKRVIIFYTTLGIWMNFLEEKKSCEKTGCCRHSVSFQGQKGSI